MRLASLAVVLFLFWLALSGHYTVFLMGSGAACAVLCAFIAARMGVVDAEGHPVHLLPGALTYFPWLWWEIAKAAWTVAKLIVHPRLPISPTMTQVAATQKTTVGVATYANSITLTPGTVTLAVDDDELTIPDLGRDRGAGMRRDGSTREPGRAKQKGPHAASRAGGLTNCRSGRSKPCCAAF
jgi:multicomponent Na+:H+ antiporter subunit E